MRVLVVLSHPSPDSLCAAAARAVVAGATAAGHEVRWRHLDAEGYAPSMPEAEWRGYETDAPPPALARDVADLVWAEALVLVHPTWWGGPPAPLKGWIDRTFRRGVAFDVEDGRVVPRLGVRHLAVVTTLGTTRLQGWATGQPGRRMLLRGLRLATMPRGRRTHWLALHDVTRTTAARRAAFLDRARHMTDLWR